MRFMVERLVSSTPLESRRREPDRAYPAWLWPVLVGAIAIGGALMLLGAGAVGATWDERIHAVMLEEYFTSGWYASPDWLVNGAPGPVLGAWPYYVYAPVAELVTQAMAVLTGAEPWGGFSESASAYTARHLATALIAAVGILGSAAIARTVTRSWSWAVVAAAFLASTPMWIGHGMFNVKDLPVATGYTLATAGFVSVCRSDYGRSWRWTLSAIAGIVAGMVLAVGTRPASGLPIALTAIGMCGVALVYLLVRRTSPAAFPHLGLRIRDLLISLVVSYALLMAIYPKGFINPYTLAKESLLISGRFPVNDAVLVNGSWVPQPPPWYYLPAWFGAQLTLVVLAFLVVFVGVWLYSWVTALRSRSGAAIERVILPVPVLLQAFLLPAMAILAHSTMYNAVRQFLFVLPAVAVLAALGVRQSQSALRRAPSGRRAWTTGLWLVVAVGIIVPTVDQIRLFPYGYVYFNEIATIQPVNGRWATDYWRASSQELATIIPGDGLESCSYVTAEKGPAPCGSQSPFLPFWGERGTAALPGRLTSTEYWFVRENGGDVSIPEGCTLHDQLTRPLKDEDVVIAQVFRCTMPEAT